MPNETRRPTGRPSTTARREPDSGAPTHGETMSTVRAEGRVMPTRKLMSARARVLAVVAVLAAGVAPAQAQAQAVFTPAADSYVVASQASSNFGTATTVKVDGTPLTVSYLKFSVSGTGTPTSAALRIWSTSDNPEGFTVHAVADTSWSETSITFNNAPEVGAVLSSSGPISSGNWYALDVSSLVTGDGTFSIALRGASSSGISLSSRESGRSPQLLVPGPPSPSPFVVQRSGSTYSAVSQPLGTTYTGSLKSVVESAVINLNRAGGGVVSFGSGTFDLGSSHFEFYDLVGTKFEGQGIDVTTIRNSMSTASDTEPFDIVRADRVVIRDLTVVAAGTFRSTSDAIDFDSGNDTLIERVKVGGARGRGIVFDGKDISGGIVRKATGNVVRDCVIQGIPSDGIELLAASGNRIEGCTVTNVAGHGIQIVKSSGSAEQPNKKPNDNVVVGNTLDNAGLDGVNITGGDRNDIEGNTILNSSDDASGRDGIRIASADSITCDENVVQGNTATDNQAVKTQRYGLSISSSECHRTFVLSNAFAGNKTGEINDLGTDTQYSTTPDEEPPSTPTNLTATASPGQAALSWSSAVDNVAVAGYTIYRDGAEIGTVNSSVLSYLDTAVLPETTYSYTVDAFDVAGGHSLPSEPAVVTTPPGPSTLTFHPTADSYVHESNPTTNYGTAMTLRVDGSPIVTTYLTFSLAGLSGTVERATLRVFANSNSSSGHDVGTVPDTSWGETTITYANAPAYNGVVGSSGAFASGQYVDVDVTSAVSGNGAISFALTGPGSTGISYASRESSSPPELVLEVSGTPPTPDEEPPSTPTNATATAGSGQVDVAWSATTDNVGVAGYTVYRDGAVLATVNGSVLSYADTTVLPETTYSYTVDAFDAAGNHSAPSAPATVTTPPGPSTITLTPSADSYVNESSPTTNYGSATTLRADGSPILTAYLKFDVTGITQPVTSAKLRLFANSNSISGHEVRSVADTSWGESTITYANAPAYGGVVASSGPFTSGQYVEVDVTPLVSDNGTVSFAVTGSGATAISYASRESANAPQLVLDFS